MSQELLYTSAPTGLKSGSRGFSTVLCTAGMAPNIAMRLETLSGYRHVFSPQDPQASLNPISWSHLRLAINGQPTSILSRIGAFGVDYSGRTNKLAHHVVPTPVEMAKAGPAWMLLQSAWVRTDWDGTCQTPPAGPAVPSGNQPLAICKRWQQLSGDAGWGGVLTETVSAPTSKPLWIIFSIDQSPALLELINESIALLPVSERWRATFSTYYTSLPPEIDCKIRCVLAGTEEAKLAPARGTVIDLSRTLAKAPQSAYVETARSGVVVALVTAPMPVIPGTTSVSSASPPLETINSDDLWPDEILLQPPTNLRIPPALAIANNPNLPPQLPGAESSVSAKEGRTRRMGWAIGISALAVILLLSLAIPIIIATKKRADEITGLAANESKTDQNKQGQSEWIRKQEINSSANPPIPEVEPLTRAQPAAPPQPAVPAEPPVTAEPPVPAEPQVPAEPPVPAEPSVPGTPPVPSELRVPGAPAGPANTPTNQIIDPGDTPAKIIAEIELFNLIETKKIAFEFDKTEVPKGIYGFKFRPLLMQTTQSNASPTAFKPTGKTPIGSRNEIFVSMASTGALTFTINLTRNDAVGNLISNVDLIHDYLKKCGNIIATVSGNRYVDEKLDISTSHMDAIREPEKLEQLMKTVTEKLTRRRDEFASDQNKLQELGEAESLLAQATILAKDDLESHLRKIKNEVRALSNVNLGAVDFFATKAGFAMTDPKPELSVPLRFKLEVKE